MFLLFLFLWWFITTLHLRFLPIRSNWMPAFFSHLWNQFLFGLLDYFSKIFRRRYPTFFRHARWLFGFFWAQSGLWCHHTDVLLLLFRHLLFCLTFFFLQLFLNLGRLLTFRRFLWLCRRLWWFLSFNIRFTVRFWTFPFFPHLLFLRFCGLLDGSCGNDVLLIIILFYDSFGHLPSWRYFHLRGFTSALFPSRRRLDGWYGRACFSRSFSVYRKQT